MTLAPFCSGNQILDLAFQTLEDLGHSTVWVLPQTLTPFQVLNVRMSGLSTRAQGSNQAFVWILTNYGWVITVIKSLQGLDPSSVWFFATLIFLAMDW